MMGGITTRILKRSGWREAEDRVESDVFDVKDCIGLVIDIDGDNPGGEVWIEKWYGDGFGYPTKAEKYDGTSRIIIDLRYVDSCRLVISNSGVYRYKYGFMYWWLLSDEEMKPVYKRFCGYNGDESYHLRCETY